MKDRYFASRMKSLTPSASISIAEKVKKLKSQGEYVIDLSWGEPDFPTPQNIVTAGRQGLDNGFTKYTQSRGLPELRNEIARKLKMDNSLAYSPESEIIVTPGGKQAILYTLLTFINSGDEVLIPEPCWLSYADCVAIAGGRFVPISTTHEDGFKATREGILERVTEKAKITIVNNPTNPTGAVWSQSDLETIAEIAASKDLLIISDEIYEKIMFDRLKITSIAVLPGMRERTIVVNGFSKSHAMTGWRIGYLASHKDFVDQILKIHQHSATCAAAVSQYAAIEALSGPQDQVNMMIAEYQSRRDFVYREFNGLKGISCIKPQGTFYAFLNVQELGMSSVEVSEYFLDRARVAVVPGSAYGKSGEGYVRISFATSNDNLRQAVENLRSIL